MHWARGATFVLVLIMLVVPQTASTLVDNRPLEPLKTYFRSDMQVGFTNRSEHGTTTFLGWMDEAQTIGRWSYRTSIGETNTWNNTHYVPYIWNETTKTVSYANQIFDFYDWYAVLRNESGVIVDDIRWTVEYWQESQEKWGVLDLYNTMFLPPAFGEDYMSFGQHYNDTSSEMNVTYTFHNYDKVKVRIDFRPATTARYRVRWQLTGIAGSPTILNTTIDSDGDGSNDTQGVVFSDDISVIWDDVNQSEMDVWYEWLDESDKLDVFIGNLTVEANEVLTIDPTINPAVGADSDDDKWESPWPEAGEAEHRITQTESWIGYYDFLNQSALQWRFQLNLAKDTTITEANISFFVTASAEASPHFLEIRRINEDDVGSLEDDSDMPDAVETNKVTIGNPDLGSDYWLNATITNLVQDQVNLAGWAADQYIGFRMNNSAYNEDSNLRIQDFQGGTGNQAYMNITYISIDNSEYNYIDETSDIDSVGDIGTHSSFSDQQSAPDSSYDTMTEADNADGFWAWDEDHYDQENTDIDSYPDVGTQSNPTYANDSVNSLNMTLMEADEGSPSGTTEYLATAFTDVSVNWASESNAYDGDWGTYAENVDFADGDDYPTAYASGFDSGASGSGTITQVDIIMRMSYASSSVSDTWGITLDVGASTDNELRAHDGNPYALNNLTFTDVTEPNDGTWTWAEIRAAEVHIDGERVGGSDNDVFNMYEFAFKVAYGAVVDYELNFEYQWTSAGYGDTDANVSIYLQTADQTAGENLKAWEWDGSAWVSLGTLTEDAWNNFTCTELDSATYYIMLNDTLQSDESDQDSWNIDLITLVTWNTTNYRLELEESWTSANYTRTNEYVCVYMGAVASENLWLQVWNSTSSSWDNLSTSLSGSQWNNYSVSDYLTSANLYIRFVDDNQTDDGSSQDTWQKDSTVLRTWMGAAELSVTVEELIGISDSTTISADYHLTVNELIGISESISVGLIYIIVILEIISLAAFASTTLIAGVSIFESIGLAAVTTTAMNLSTTISEVINVSATPYPYMTAVQSSYEILPFSDIANTTLNAGITILESLPIGDTISTTLNAGVTVLESLPLGDTMSSVLSAVVNSFESIPFFDSVSVEIPSGDEYFLTTYEVINFSATPSTVLDASITAYAIIDFSDSVIPAMSAYVGIFEILPLSDIATTTLNAGITILESLPIGDTISTTLNAGVTVLESLPLGDTMSSVLSAVVNSFESIPFFDTQQTSISLVQASYEVIDLSDSILPAMGSYVTVLESLPLADIMTSTLDGSVIILESLPIGEAISTTMSVAVSIFETIPFFDSVNVVMNPIFSIVIYEVIPIATVVVAVGGPDTSGIFYLLFLNTQMWGYLGPAALVIGGYIVAKKDRILGIFWFVVICLVIAQYLNYVAATPQYWWHIYILLLGGLFTCIYPLLEER